MILNLIILVALIWAFMVGYSRGLILQVIYSLGTLLAAFIAANNYKELAQQLSVWVPFSNATQNSHLLLFSDKLLFQLDEAFYASIAFFGNFCSRLSYCSSYRSLFAFCTQSFRKKREDYCWSFRLCSNLFRVTNATYGT